MNEIYPTPANLIEACTIIGATLENATKYDFCPNFHITVGNRTLELSRTFDNKRTHFKCTPNELLNCKGERVNLSDVPTSNFKRDTEAKRLAKVLTKCFADFEPYMVKQAEILENHNTYYSKRDAIIRQLGAFIELRGDNYRIATKPDSHFGSVDISSDSVNMDLNNLSAEKALAILELLGK